MHTFEGHDVSGAWVALLAVRGATSGRLLARRHVSRQTVGGRVVAVPAAVARSSVMLFRLAGCLFDSLRPRTTGVCARDRMMIGQSSWTLSLTRRRGFSKTRWSLGRKASSGMVSYVGSKAVWS